MSAPGYGDSEDLDRDSAIRCPASLSLFCALLGLTTVDTIRTRHRSTRFGNL
jgi:hypothetical protein